jgi:hypothetical protein
MFQRVCDKCGKVIQKKDNYVKLGIDPYGAYGTIWKDAPNFTDVHLCEKCIQELVKWIYEGDK